MNILTTIATALTKSEQFLLSLLSKEQKLQKAFSTLSTPVIGAASAVFYDVTKTVAAAEAAAVAGAAGDVPLTITLSSTTLALLKQTIADFRDGEKTVIADFAALNIKL